MIFIKRIPHVMNDIVYSKSIMTFNQVKMKYDLSGGDYLRYYSIRSAIPIEWIKRIETMYHSTKNEKYEFSVKPGYSVRSINLCNCKSSTFYNIMIDTYGESPVAVKRWNELYYDIDWERSFTLAFRLLRDTKIQTLQYKILMRIFPCNSKLFRWKIVYSPRCNFCYEIDSIEHYLYECNLVRKFWSAFEKWWKHISDCYIHLATKDILFGIHLDDSKMLRALNYSILIAKRYIYVEKYKSNSLFFLVFLQDLKMRLETDIYIEKRHIDTNIVNQAKLETYLFIHEKM